MTDEGAEKGASQTPSTVAFNTPTPHFDLQPLNLDPKVSPRGHAPSEQQQQHLEEDRKRRLNAPHLCLIIFIFFANFFFIYIYFFLLLRPGSEAAVNINGLSGSDFLSDVTVRKGSFA